METLVLSRLLSRSLFAASFDRGKRARVPSDYLWPAYSLKFSPLWRKFSVPPIRFFLSALILLLSSESLTYAQVDFKGERPTNPVVNLRQVRPKASPARHSRSAQPVDLGSDDIEELIANGNAARDAKRFAHAEQYYRRAANLGRDARVYFGLGNVYFDQQLFDKAAQAYEQAIQLKPEDTEAHFYLGVTYYSIRRYAEGIEQFKLVTKLAPDDVKAYNYLAILYEQQERYPEAIELYKQLMALKPSDS